MDKSKIKELIIKTKNTLNEEGIKAFLSKSYNYITKRNRGQILARYYKDVLFINGCFLPHPQRYRVDHQIEQLLASNITCDRVNYDKITIDLEKYYRAFVFYRCPMTDEIDKFIDLAKKNNKVVFYDVDDLVIDTSYTNMVGYVKNMKKEDKKVYDNGVKLMAQTLKKCDYAITTTTRLQKELSKYSKEVFINRNVASEKMVELSIMALNETKRKDDKIIMGYLSGSITHNEDFELILPTIKKLLKEEPKLYLKIVGILDIPTEFKDESNKIIIEPFVDWKELPFVISTLDINLAPLVDNIFNEAKSENKWMEAALCKVVTVASDVGAFHESIRDNIDGVLCKTENEWYQKLKKVIKDSEYRKQIAENAHQRVLEEYITTYTGNSLARYVSSKLRKNIRFVLPSTNISGGVNVIIKHCEVLRKHGYDVGIIDMANSNKKEIGDGISVLNASEFSLLGNSGQINTLVASLWSTVGWVQGYSNAINRKYLVQGFETDFSKYGDYARIVANSTYSVGTHFKYITISKWCEKWLKEKYHQEPMYIPNGIDLNLFKYRKRSFKGKIRILVEGNSKDFYKNVDESFRIVEKLDPNKFEIFYLSYNGKPKKWYRVDKFLQAVPHKEVSKIYESCDILIKSSLLESFSYPPLEMMATGGISVVLQNCGNSEFLKDGYNCLFYEKGNLDSAVQAINKIVKDSKLREKLIKNGLETAKKRDWNGIEKTIKKAYFE